MKSLPNYLTAYKQLQNFIENGLKDYSKKRNYDFGIDNRTNISCLSPFISRRILHEKEVVFHCLEKHNLQKIEKFIQEVFWRTYWKGWLEGRPQIWQLYNEKLDEYKNQSIKTNYLKDYNKAISGQTGITCFDSWVEELKSHGYLHNHTRMWFASIWIFTLNLPWELGADFFYKHLLDADAASNTLSWRWVAGLHTPGKIYLARQDNIEKYSNFSFSNKQQLTQNVTPPNHTTYEYIQPDYSNNNFKKINYFLFNSNNLIYDEEKIKYLKSATVLFIDDQYKDNNSELKNNFNELAKDEYIKWLTSRKIKTQKLLNRNEMSQFFKGINQDFYTFYPAIGYEKDTMKELVRKYSIKLKFIYDDYDLFCWPYAKSGFFKFKSKIENIISKLILN